ncbi:MAG TPA: hypothetical protein VFV99_03930 [Kofleriaceae bacterium]|nr:hypothetical protein [Kofleriaceae bacterium]
MKRACLLFALAACTAEPAEINYTGETRRFVVDQIAVPLTTNEARATGADLDGDRTIDNQLGMVTATLASVADDVTKHGNDMIASGVIASSVELVADDFTTDETVALRYFGADGDDAELIAGSLFDGTFEVSTKERGAGAVHLPVFVDADPVILPLVQMRARLVADGHGGFDATIQGAVPPEVARGAAYTSLVQMFDSYPSAHVAFFRMLDTQPYDFQISRAEFEANSLIKSLMAPDIEISDERLLSIGFRVHLAPCADGTCVTAPPADACFDRVQDAGETGVDCGGPCHACEANATCFDGVRNGLETDVDCGSECGPCATGKDCWSGSDCVSGTCGQPCSGTFCGTYTLDVCR